MSQKLEETIPPDSVQPTVPPPEPRKKAKGKPKKRAEKGITNAIRVFIRRNKKLTYHELSEKIVKEFYPERYKKGGRTLKKAMKQAEHKIWAERSGWYKKKWKKGKGPKRHRRARRKKAKA